jgi:hypothetical protein
MSNVLFVFVLAGSTSSYTGDNVWIGTKKELIGNSLSDISDTYMCMD